MKRTLLELTQDILASMDSDEVNSISDTSEASQVARIIRQAYLDMVEDIDAPGDYTVFELEASLDAAKPVLMTIPDRVNKLVWVKYDRSKVDETEARYEEIQFMPMAEFLNRSYQLNPSDTSVDTFNIVSLDGSTIPINFENDIAPTYYTTLGDNSTIIFNSYDSAVDSTLQKDKTACYGRKSTDLLLVDSAVPNLDEAFFPRLLNEAKVLAFAELKSVDHAIANRNAQRSRWRSARRKYRTSDMSDFDKLPNFSRR